MRQSFTEYLVTIVPEMSHARLKQIFQVLLILVAFLGIYWLLVGRYCGNLNTNKKSPERLLRHDLCGCERPLMSVDSPEMDVSYAGQSTCGPSADARGPHQRVLSFAFYGDTKTQYFEGIAINSKIIPQLYPGWVMRLYHDISPTNQEGTKNLCEVICAFPVLDDCNVNDLGQRLGADVKSKFGMVWRFMVLGDPLVDIFSSRDLDSPIHQREVDAVDDWLKTNQTWHVMRDHVLHVTTMLGGMWGVKNSVDFAAMKNMRDILLLNSVLNYKRYDQLLLHELVFPVASKSLVAHDSFLCHKYNGTRPFPTRRMGMTFVGDMYGLAIDHECPKECRPPEHQNWIYC